MEENSVYNKVYLIFTKYKEKYIKTSEKMSEIERISFERRLYTMSLREVIPYTCEIINDNTVMLKINIPKVQNILIREIPE